MHRYPGLDDSLSAVDLCTADNPNQRRKARSESFSESTCSIDARPPLKRSLSDSFLLSSPKKIEPAISPPASRGLFDLPYESSDPLIYATDSLKGGINASNESQTKQSVISRLLDSALDAVDDIEEADIETLLKQNLTADDIRHLNREKPRKDSSDGSQ